MVAEINSDDAGRPPLPPPFVVPAHRQVREAPGSDAPLPPLHLRGSGGSESESAQSRDAFAGRDPEREAAPVGESGDEVAERPAAWLDQIDERTREPDFPQPSSPSARDTAAQSIPPAAPKESPGDEWGGYVVQEEDAPEETPAPMPWAESASAAGSDSQPAASGADDWGDSSSTLDEDGEREEDEPWSAGGTAGAAWPEPLNRIEPVDAGGGDNTPAVSDEWVSHSVPEVPIGDLGSVVDEEESDEVFFPKKDEEDEQPGADVVEHGEIDVSAGGSGEASDAAAMQWLFDDPELDVQPTVEIIPTRVVDRKKAADAPSPSSFDAGATDATIRIAEKLERIAAALRNAGINEALADMGSDPLSALIAGYLAGIQDRDGG